MPDLSLNDYIYRLRAMFKDMGPTGKGRRRGYYEDDLAAFENIAGVLQAAEWKPIVADEIVPAGSIVVIPRENGWNHSYNTILDQKGAFWLEDGFTYHRTPYEPELPKETFHV